MQKWKKLGLIYDGTSIPDFTHAAVPVGHFLNKDLLRIFFSSRNPEGRSMPVFLDYNLKSKTIEKINTAPLLELGKPGCFDDSGVMPTCLATNGKKLYMYYVGWNLGVTVPFRNSIGLSVSHDGGQTFRKLYEGPVLDRTYNEPHFSATCTILIENGVWRMWYQNCVGWQYEQEKLTHKYHIKYAESPNGVQWSKTGIVAIDFLYPDEYAIAVPRVLKEDNVYKMWYSYRSGLINETYRIGYAESIDGKKWTRMDDQVDFNVSANGWDNEMIEYPFIFDYDNERYMLYNGNNYGKTGFGLAKLEKI